MDNQELHGHLLIANPAGSKYRDSIQRIVHSGTNITLWSLRVRTDSEHDRFAERMLISVCSRTDRSIEYHRKFD